jgi:hypothetical protein
MGVSATKPRTPDMPPTEPAWMIEHRSLLAESDARRLESDMAMIAKLTEMQRDLIKCVGDMTSSVDQSRKRTASAPPKPRKRPAWSGGDGCPVLQFLSAWQQDELQLELSELGQPPVLYSISTLLTVFTENSDGSAVQGVTEMALGRALTKHVFTPTKAPFAGPELYKKNFNNGVCHGAPAADPRTGARYWLYKVA